MACRQGCSPTREDQSLKLNKLIIYERKSSAGKEAEVATERSD